MSRTEIRCWTQVGAAGNLGQDNLPLKPIMQQGG